MRLTRNLTLPLLAAALLAGCGSSHTVNPTVQLERAHPCPPPSSPGYYMQCAAGAPGQRINPFQQQSGVFGIDCAWSCPSGPVARSHGARFAFSYLSGTSKDWRYSTLHSYPAAGLTAGFVWETAAKRALSDCAGGASDARRAAQELTGLGARGAPVFFAVDFDSTGYTPGGIVTRYFRCAANVLGWSHTGVYGGLNTMRIVLDTRTVKYGWQTIAWSYGYVDPRACLYQNGINGSLAGYSIDPDRALCRDFGQWPSPTPPPPPLPVCFTHRISKTECARIKRQVASWGRAGTSSQRAYQARGCDRLEQRIHWFSARLKAQPRVKSAYRRGALVASRDAYRKRSCSLFASRAGLFDSLITRAHSRY